MHNFVETRIPGIQYLQDACGTSWSFRSTNVFWVVFRFFDLRPVSITPTATRCELRTSFMSRVKYVCCEKMLLIGTAWAYFVALTFGTLFGRNCRLVGRPHHWNSSLRLQGIHTPVTRQLRSMPCTCPYVNNFSTSPHTCLCKSIGFVHLHVHVVQLYVFFFLTRSIHKSMVFVKVDVYSAPRKLGTFLPP